MQLSSDIIVETVSDIFFLALEPRVCTRWEIQKFAREAYNMGIRYIGGCCGFEPYHIRAIAEEVSELRRLHPTKLYNLSNRDALFETL